MSIVKTVTFPDRTTVQVEQTSSHLWVVAAPPMELEDIAGIDHERTLSIVAEINDLDVAISDPTVVTEASLSSTIPIIRTARLANMSLSVLVDEDDDVVDLAGYRNEDGPLLPKTGESLVDVLVSQARDRIAELTKSKEAVLTGFGSERADRRLDWRIVRWTAGQASAERFANQMNANARPSQKVVVLLATSSE